MVFVLATTDPQRVLPTVISRCQRFDFRRIPLDAMVEHLQFISTQETIAISDSAIELIAQIAQGGLRDAESLLDQLSLLPDEIGVEQVWDLVGAVPERELLALLDAIAQKDAQQVVTQLRHLMDNGKEPLVLLQNLTGFYRDLLLAKTAPGQRDMVALTQPTWEALVERAPRYSIADILAVQRRTIAAEPLLKNTTQPRLWLEISLLNLLQDPVEAAQPTPVRPAAPSPAPPQSASSQSTPSPAPSTQSPSASPPQSSHASQHATLPVRPPASTPQATSTPEPLPSIPPPSGAEPVPASPQAQPVAPAPAASGATLSAHWTAILNSLPFSKSALLKQHVSVQSETERQAVLALSPNMRAFAPRIRGLFGELEGIIGQHLGRTVNLELVLGAAQPSPASSYPPAQSDGSNGHAPSTPSVPTPASNPVPPPSADRPSSQPLAQPVPSQEPIATPAAVPGRSPVDEPDILDRATSRLADFFSGSVVEEFSEENESTQSPSFPEGSAAALPALETATKPLALDSSSTEGEPDEEEYELPF